MSERVTTVLAREDHAEAIAAFYRASWDPNATPDAVVRARREAAAANVAHPGEVPPKVIVLQGSRVIGYCGSVAQRLWDGQVERPAYWVKGLQVLPEFRSGPVGFFVVRELANHLELSTILTVAPAARRLFGAAGYADHGAITNWVRPLRPGRLLARLDLGALGIQVLPGWAASLVRMSQQTGIAGAAGGIAGLAIRVAAQVRRIPATGIRTTGTAELPAAPELRQLWERTRVAIGVGPVRDERYLVPRFGGPRDTYQFAVARRSGTLVGMAVLRRPGNMSDARLRGMRVATVSDILFPPGEPGVGFALLGEVERMGFSADADALLCTTSAPGLTRVLRQQAYLRASANVHFFHRDRTQQTVWPSALSAWWLARGDGYSDEVF